MNEKSHLSNNKREALRQLRGYMETVRPGGCADQICYLVSEHFDNVKYNKLENVLIEKTSPFTDPDDVCKIIASNLKLIL